MTELEKLDRGPHLLGIHAVVHQTEVPDDITDGTGFRSTERDAGVLLTLGMERQEIVVLSKDYTAFTQPERQMLLVIRT